MRKCTIGTILDTLSTCSCYIIRRSQTISITIHRTITKKAVKILPFFYLMARVILTLVILKIPVTSVSLCIMLNTILCHAILMQYHNNILLLVTQTVHFSYFNNTSSDIPAKHSRNGIKQPLLLLSQMQNIYLSDVH